MGTTVDLIAGLTLLQTYRDDETGFDVGADHDVIYAYETSKALSEDDVNKMVSFGWHQEHDEVDYESDFKYSEYRQDESWHFYT